jgi:hypothetical protein
MTSFWQVVSSLEEMRPNFRADISLVISIEDDIHEISIAAQ